MCYILSYTLSLGECNLLYKKLSFLQNLPPRGANSWCDVPVTAWRTSCLYGVTYSRASPRLPEDVTSSVSETDNTLFEVRIYLYLQSQGGALRAYPELLTAESI